MNQLRGLIEEGQSFWLDYISRDFIDSGELDRWIQEDGLRGMTSNPTIFEKAISGGSSYDQQIRKGADQGLAPAEILERIFIKDVQAAADKLASLHKETNGSDGFVSLEVNPHLAHEAEKTVEEVRRLADAVSRPNVMFKIPGTSQGLKAVEQCVFEGFNINITLLFSVETYEEVARAYMSGLERRRKSGLPLVGTSSVASFFVSRIDSKINERLDAIIQGGGGLADRAKTLINKIGVSNAQMAYQKFQQTLSSDHWRSLEESGASPQRVLWGSTSAKDDRLSDVFYINELIGPLTVNTMPPKTADAFRTKGKVYPSLSEGVLVSGSYVLALEGLGISLTRVTEELVDEGVEKFRRSYDQLLAAVTEKTEKAAAASA